MPPHATPDTKRVAGGREVNAAGRPTISGKGLGVANGGDGRGKGVRGLGKEHSGGKAKTRTGFGAGPSKRHR